MTPAFRSYVSRVLWGSSALVSAGSAQDLYLIEKTLFFRQTSATAVIPDPVRPFEVNTASPVNFALTMPSGAPSSTPIRYEPEDEEFGFELIYPSQAALDAAFPAGVYRMTATNRPVLALDMPDVFPSASPRVAQVTGGTWSSGGLLVINPAQAATIVVSPFSDYGTTAAADGWTARVFGFTEQDDVVSVEAVTRAGLGMPVQASAPTSFTIPASRLVNGRMYFGSVEFFRLPTLDTTTIAGSAAVAVLMKRLDFIITAQTNAALPAPPTIATSPASRTVAGGGSTTFTVSATVPEGNRGSFVIWTKDGVEVQPDARITRSANGLSLTINQLTMLDAGNYMLEIASAGGTARSVPAALTVPVVPGIARLSNLSILTSLATGDSFTMGYVTGGAGTAGAKPMVIRAVGPSLGQLGVAGALDDPKLELFAGSAKTGENDNWGGAAELANAMVAVGAFAFSGPTSRDAAALANISSSDNSVKVSAVAGSGSVIAELYDATPNANFATSTPRLVNVSVLKNIGSGLTAGFVVGGSAAKTVLIRAVGPTLGGPPFNVPGVVADPQLALFTGSIRIAENNDWAGTPALSAAFSQVGAFALPANSRDAALVATLGPGNYTVQVRGAGTSSGTALVEVYELP